MSVELPFLTLVAFIMAALNTAIGPCGGVLFASMAAILPATAVVPAHAIVQGSGAIFRFALLRHHVVWPVAGAFLTGGMLGIILGYETLVRWQPSEDWLRLLLGIFILSTIVTSPWRPNRSFPLSDAIIGAFTSFLTMFVGATGPLVAAWVARRQPDHARVVGTYSACMTFQHGAKILLFSLLGFSFVQFGFLLAIMICATALGSWCGRFLLFGLPAELLKSIFKLVVIALGVYILAKAILGLLTHQSVI